VVPVAGGRETTRGGRLPHLTLGRYRRYQRPIVEAWLAEQAAGPPVRSGRDLPSGPG
jgi:hypothetical protein